MVDQLVDLLGWVGGSATAMPAPVVYHSWCMVTGSMEPAATEPGDVWFRLSFSRAARIFLSTAALWAGVKGAMVLGTVWAKQGGDGVWYGDDMSSNGND